MRAEEQLLFTFERFRKALFAFDADGLRELIDEDYQGIDRLGQLQDMNMILDAYRPGGVILDRYDVEELDTRIVGNVGIVMGKGHIRGTYADHKFEHHLRFLDMYIYREGVWRLYLSQVTPLGAV